MTKPDFQIGSLSVSPSRRTLTGRSGSANLPPQVMAVFECLANDVDQLVSRKTLFERCWGNAPVGDDSLNRALSAIRRALEQVGSIDVRVETFARSGYRLVREAEEESGEQLAWVAANDAWRAGLPKPDTAAIADLENRIRSGGGSAREWGMLALLLRKAVEYADADQSAAFVTRCEEAARRALESDASEGNAQVALATVAPIFGNWAQARERLIAVLERDPAHVAARHDLAVLEMATGRPSAAAPLIERLMDEDGLAPTYHYKRVYHLWTLGDLGGAERVSSRALQLWPRHPAIWAARFWMLIFTARAAHALHLLGDTECRPAMADATAVFLGDTARIVAARETGTESPDAFAAHCERCMTLAGSGPANAVAALFSLCAIGAVDRAFDVAHAYYLSEGDTPVPLRSNPGDLAISDQHRRITQPLFIPATEVLRGDPRFRHLCRAIGMEDYWHRFDLMPDFAQAHAEGRE